MHFRSPNEDPLPNAMASQIMVVLIGILVLFLAAGCSKGEMSKAFQTAKSKTKSMTDYAVAEKLPQLVKVNLDLEPYLIEVSNAELDLISIGYGRPNVVQITTYNTDASYRSYPAILLYGVTNISKPANLPRQKVQCDVYYQESETSPITMTKPG